MSPRPNFYELCNRKVVLIILFGSAILFFIYSNILPTLTPSCIPRHTIEPIIYHPPTGSATNNIFVREKFRVIQLLGNTAPGGDNLGESIDLLLNTRKLTLFAVHELNEIIYESCDENCGQKWWADPMQTLGVQTASFKKYLEHIVTFIANPGNVPFHVAVRQNYIPLSGTNWTELEIVGTFVRLDGGQIGPPDTANTTVTVATPDVDEDPELFSWPRNKSFMVGDYVDFSDKAALYQISPGGNASESLYCGDALKMLIMVSSAPTHFEHRKVIRETYGLDGNLLPKKVRLVFLFGLVGNATLQSILAAEAAEHEDIIQASFLDSYHNLSLSHLSMYNWVQTTCESVGLPKYVLKADDDFLINVDIALRVAYENPSYEMIGTSFCHTGPIRDTTYMYKYYTPRYMHMPDRYAGYLSGVAYVVRTDIFPRMLKISLTTPMIHMDDAYITGILPRQLGILPAGSPLFTYGRGKLDACSLKKMACSYVLNTADMKTQWTEFIKPVPSDCNLTSIESQFLVPPINQEFKNFCDFV